MTNNAPNTNHALILGASGISGWALLNAARTYPTPETFTRITATTNRPMTLQQAQIPTDQRITLVNGVDLTQDEPSVRKTLLEKIPSIASVTHLFFAAYISRPTFAALRETNVHLARVAVAAVSGLAPRLQAVILQTGGKAYGVEFTDTLGNPSTPLREDMPRIPAPEGDNIFYYAQRDAVREVAAGAGWTFTEVRPDVIVGFVPGDNAMDCARGLALWLNLWKEVHGAGTEVPFPGTDKSWLCRHTDTSQDILAKFEIYAALNQKDCGSKDGGTFNAADGAVVTWKDKWPAICAYFGLKGTGPKSGADGSQILKFAEENKGKWADIVAKNGLRSNAAETYDFNFLYFVMGVFSFDREYDLSRSKAVGFKEEIDTVKGYTTAFDRLKAAKIIPG